VRDGLNDALLRASADRAAQAILMTPLTTHDQEDEDHRLASKVMTGTCSACTVTAGTPAAHVMAAVLALAQHTSDNQCCGGLSPVGLLH